MLQGTTVHVREFPVFPVVLLLILGRLCHWNTWLHLRKGRNLHSGSVWKSGRTSIGKQIDASFHLDMAFYNFDANVNDANVAFQDSAKGFKDSSL